MSIELIDRRKFPRLLLAHPDGHFDLMGGLQFLWPKGGKSPVLDLSYSGLAINGHGFMDNIKLGDYVEGNILLPGEDQQQVQVALRVVRKTATVIGFKIDSTSPEGRIKIDQTIKDYIVAENIREMQPELLKGHLDCDTWYHGPFDTNFFIWKDGFSVAKAYIEYDNTVLVYENGYFRVARTASTADEAAGYGAPFLIKNFSEQKLSLGHGWIDRLQRLLIRIPKGNDDTQAIFDLLQRKKMGL
ncbi:MAG: hypothetical protein RJB66_1469 [Pseudomonadota bacterium]